MKQSNTSTDKHDLQSDFIFPITEKPRSQPLFLQHHPYVEKNRTEIDSFPVHLFVSHVSEEESKMALYVFNIAPYHVCL